MTNIPLSVQPIIGHEVQEAFGFHSDLPFNGQSWDLFGRGIYILLSSLGGIPRHIFLLGYSILVYASIGPYLPDLRPTQLSFNLSRTVNKKFLFT